ncbi:MAG: hypothetical protein H0U79_08190, partial [Solirubrobacterales bacterium]|nr:hypothetical protein [Solirubrobacterales bacterium]
REIGARPARGRALAIGVGAGLRARVMTAGGMDFGAAATEAFVFEHLEVAHGQLAEQLASRVGDERTAAVVRVVRVEDEEMAATIGRNWGNVLSLSLATTGLPVLRPVEGDGP